MVSISKKGGFNFYLFDIVVVIFAFFGLAVFLLIKRSFRIPKYSYLFIIFSLICFSSLLLASASLSTEEILVSSFYLIRFVIYLLAGIVVFNVVDKKYLTSRKILSVFIISGLFLAFSGFIQLIFLPDFTVLDPILGWDPHKNRLASTFFDPNFLGAYFVLCLVILLERFYPFKNTISYPVGKFEIFSLITILVALVFTFSRSAWGMFGIIVLVYGLFRSKKLLITAVLVMFLTYFAVPRIQTRISGITDPADSAAFRLVSWGNTVKVIKDNYWTGVGFNSFRYAQRDYGFLTPDQDESHSGSGSDSSLLFVFATTGILGVLTYFLALLFPLYDSFKTRYSNWLIILSSLIGILMESQFINSLFYPQIMFFLFCILFSTRTTT